MDHLCFIGKVDQHGVENVGKNGKRNLAELIKDDQIQSRQVSISFTSSCSFLNSPFFHPSSRFSMGDVKGRRVLVEVKKSFSTPSTVPFIAELIRFTFTSSLPKKQRGGSRSPPSSTSKNWRETLAAPPDCNAIQVSRCSSSSRRCRSIPAPSPCALLHLRSGMEALKLHNSNVFSDTGATPAHTRPQTAPEKSGRESERGLDWFQPNHFVVPPPAIRASM